MWLTALILGFAGSMHCLGMCSPLLMAVTSMKRGAIMNRFIYNSGRIFAYACMGAAVASAGMVFPLQRFQNLTSLGLGIVLILIGLGGIKNLRIPILTSALQKVTTRIKAVFAHHMINKSHAAMFIMGSLNGFLPCGLSLIALTWCLTLRGPVDGFNFMLAFGAGTLPVMAGFTGFLPTVIQKFRLSLHKATTSMLIISGLILIIRVFIVHMPHTSTARAGMMDFILCQ